jgi:hypothetical protein
MDLKTKFAAMILLSVFPSLCLASPSVSDADYVDCMQFAGSAQIRTVPMYYESTKSFRTDLIKIEEMPLDDRFVTANNMYIPKLLKINGVWKQISINNLGFDRNGIAEIFIKDTPYKLTFDRDQLASISVLSKKPAWTKGVNHTVYLAPMDSELKYNIQRDVEPRVQSLPGALHRGILARTFQTASGLSDQAFQQIHLRLSSQGSEQNPLDEAAEVRNETNSNQKVRILLRGVYLEIIRDAYNSGVRPGTPQFTQMVDTIIASKISSLTKSLDTIESLQIKKAAIDRVFANYAKMRARNERQVHAPGVEGVELARKNLPAGEEDQVSKLIFEYASIEQKLKTAPSSRKLQSLLISILSANINDPVSQILVLKDQAKQASDTRFSCAKINVDGWDKAQDDFKRLSMNRLSSPL